MAHDNEDMVETGHEAPPARRFTAWAIPLGVAIVVVSFVLGVRLSRAPDAGRTAAVTGADADSTAASKKPGRGGMQAIAELHATWEAEGLRASMISPEDEPDSTTRALRIQEAKLENAIMPAGTTLRGALARPGQHGELIDLLYRIANRSHDRRDIARALAFWRNWYDDVAVRRYGSHEAHARLEELEQLMLAATMKADSTRK